MPIPTFSTETVSKFLLRRQHISSLTQGSTADDVVKITEDAGGLHAQDFECAYLALWNRIRGFRKEWLDEKLFIEKRLVAAHLMRVTLHVVSAWEFPMYFQATRGALRRFLNVRSVPYPPKLTKAHREILRLIEDKGKATMTDIRLRLKSLGLSTENLHRIVHYELAAAGLIIRCGRQANRWQWTLTKEWLPQISLPESGEEDAKKWLIVKYLRSFGPSNIDDIISWTWHSATETRKMLNQLLGQNEVARVKIQDEDETLWVCYEDVGELEHTGAQIKKTLGKNEKELKVLYEFDPLTVGMRRRWKNLIKVSAKPRIRPHPAPGVVMLDGDVIGRYVTWPHLKLFFNERVRNSRIVKAIIREMERQANFKKMQKLCITVLNNTFVKHLKEEGFKPEHNLLCKRYLFTDERLYPQTP